MSVLPHLAEHVALRHPARLVNSRSRDPYANSDLLKETAGAAILMYLRHPARLGGVLAAARLAAPRLVSRSSSSRSSSNRSSSSSSSSSSSISRRSTHLAAPRLRKVHCCCHVRSLRCVHGEAAGLVA